MLAQERVALPLAWSALLAFSSRFGLPLAQAFTRIMKRLHLYVTQPNSFPSFPPCSHSSGQYWCWISPQFPGERIGGEYFWLWIALFASAMLYTPLYFWAEGFWSVDKENKLHWWKTDQRVEYTQRRAALGMLL